MVQSHLDIVVIITIATLCTKSTDSMEFSKVREDRLVIKPQGPSHKPVGKNLFFTCQAEVANPALLKTLKWLKPNGQPIPEDDRVYTEEQPGDNSIMLFIKSLSEDDSGSYICQGIYINNQNISATVKVSTFVGITWKDAPADQYAIIHSEYKIRCIVRASPPATVDWLKESQIVSEDDRYVIEPDGLLIKNVNLQDTGIYTCRARVAETGNLEERNIRLQVQIPPEWTKLPGPAKGIEQDKVEFGCQATGIPQPFYTWVDFHGRDATEKDGWTIEKDTGRLIGYELKMEDEGKYTCIAENSAGRIEAETYLDVIIQPRIRELMNKTFVANKASAKIVCKASGDPLPDIIWRKMSKNESFVEGGQEEDDRIFVENRIERAPESRNAKEVFWKVSELTIRSVKRVDNGLYECQARNEGGVRFKSAHIQVEFAPTFEEQPMSEQWSWDQNAVNLTCIATSIPNASITWWVRDKEINREIIDRNIVVVGNGPRSDLTITPLDLHYYERYTCKATNIHGEAFFEIELKQAKEPSFIQQAVIDKVTATTILFRFIAPTDPGGFPIDSYAVEFKEASQQWQDARKRVWQAIPSGIYILEGLQPKITYDFRFGAKNQVGFSQWGASQQFTMPQRGPPEAPNVNTLEYQTLVGDVLNLTSPEKYELVWNLPENNGEPIDFFEITFFPVAFDGRSQTWQRHGDLFRTEVPFPGNVRYIIQNLHPNTHYLVEIRAHNFLGFSSSTRLVVKTARDSNHQVDVPIPNSHGLMNCCKNLCSNISEPLMLIFILSISFLNSS